MSYLVLARKWRPMQFEDVIAQNHVTTTLRNAIVNNRLASAYLFSGPRGIGKTTTARIFAKSINCDNGPTPTPCNKCASCNEITNSRSLDVFEIDGASNRGIDEVRNLRENLKYAASKGKHKIYIIDEVHMLTTEAFNALLKTLEEPPSKVLFIFATTESHKVPATILSRCQRYDFRRIPLNEIINHLQKICAEEKIKIDDESLYLIAKKSEGSMRDSQSLLDQVVSFCGQNVNLNELSELLGIIDQELYFEYTDCLAKRDATAGLKLIENIFKQGYDLSEFLNGLIEHFRNILVLKATNNMDLLEGLESYTTKFQETANNFSETDLLRLIKLTSETSYQIKRSPNPKIILEMLLLKMMKMDKSVELDQLLTHIDSLKNVPDPKADNTIESTKKYQVADHKPGIPSENQTIKVINDKVSNKKKDCDKNNNEETIGDAELVTLSNLKEKWSAIIDEVRSKKIHLGSFLNEGYPTNIKDGILEISFGKENGFHINTINQNKKLIQTVIFNQTGLKLKIFCKKNESEDFKEIISNHKPNLPAQSQKNEESTLQIPIVKKVIELFDGEIVS